MLRKLIAAAAIAVLPAGFARAQVADIATGLPASAYGWNTFPIYGHSRTPEQAGREFEIERNYREAVKKIPGQEGVERSVAKHSPGGSGIGGGPAPAGITGPRGAAPPTPHRNRARTPRLQTPPGLDL